MKTPFSQPILAAAVAALFVAPSVWAVDVTCDSSHEQCHFFTLQHADSQGNATNTYTWGDYRTSTIDLKDDVLNVKVVAGQYQNKPNPTTSDGSSQGTSDPFIIQNRNNLLKSGTVHFQAGVNATLSEQGQSDDLIQLNGVTAQLDKGVTLTVNPSYVEKHNIKLDDERDDVESGNAIRAENSTITSSADINLNGRLADAYHLYNSMLHAKDHNITMTGDVNQAFYMYGNSTANVTNVHITGKGELDRAIWIDSIRDDPNLGSVSPSIHLRNSTISLTGKNSNLIYGVGGTVHTDNVTASAKHGISLFEDDDDSLPREFHFKNSNITGSDSLLSLNPKWLNDVLDDDEKQPLEQGYDITIHSDNSQLNGAIILNRQDDKDSKVGLTHVNLSNNSVWNIQQNSEIDSLKLEKSTVNLTNPTAGQFNTLTINGDLSGDGMFRLNSDIAGGKADLLNVKGKVSGSHVLNINNTKAEPANTDGKIPVVKTGSSGADAFKLGNANGVVEAGKYLYALKQDGSDWNLVYDNTPATNPTPTQPATPTPPPTQPITPIVPITPSQPVAPTPTVNKNFNYSLMGTLAHAQAAALGLQQQNQVLNERQAYLHEHTRSQGLWTNGNISETERKGSQINGGNASGFTDKTKAWQLGYDYRLPNGYVGLLSGQSRHELDYNVDLYENSQVVGDTFALYGGAHFNTWFVDGTLRHTRYTASNPQFARDRFRVNSLNIQGGKQVKLNEQWSLVPQAAITIGRLSGSNMMENSTLLQTQLGADLQGKFAINGSAWLQPKIGVYYVGDHRGVDVKFNHETFRAPAAGHRVAAKVGTDVLFNQGASRIGLQFQTEHGSRLKRPYGVEMGFRHSW